jgi:hypothetical protein
MVSEIQTGFPRVEAKQNDRPSWFLPFQMVGF